MKAALAPRRHDIQDRVRLGLRLPVVQADRPDQLRFVAVELRGHFVGRWRPAAASVDVVEAQRVFAFAADSHQAAVRQLQRERRAGDGEAAGLCPLVGLGGALVVPARLLLPSHALAGRGIGRIGNLGR